MPPNSCPLSGEEPAPEFSDRLNSPAAEGKVPLVCKPHFNFPIPILHRERITIWEIGGTSLPPIDSLVARTSPSSRACPRAQGRAARNLCWEFPLPESLFC